MFLYCSVVGVGQFAVPLRAQGGVNIQPLHHKGFSVSVRAHTCIRVSVSVK